MAGKTFQDRELAAQVRTIALERMLEILRKQKPKELYEQILVKLSGTVLPRLNEVSGPDGEPIPLLHALTLKHDAILHNDGNGEDTGA